VRYERQSNISNRDRNRRCHSRHAAVRLGFHCRDIFVKIKPSYFVILSGTLLMIDAFVKNQTANQYIMLAAYCFLLVAYIAKDGGE